MNREYALAMRVCCPVCDAHEGEKCWNHALGFHRETAHLARRTRSIQAIASSLEEQVEPGSPPVTGDPPPASSNELGRAAGSRDRGGVRHPAPCHSEAS